MSPNRGENRTYWKPEPSGGLHDIRYSTKNPQCEPPHAVEFMVGVPFEAGKLYHFSGIPAPIEQIGAC